MDRIQYLWQQFFNKMASDEEVDELVSLIANAANDEANRAALDLLAEQTIPLQNYDPKEWQHIIDAALKPDQHAFSTEHINPSHSSKGALKVPILKAAWVRYAAAIILILGSAAYLYNYTSVSKRNLAGTTSYLKKGIPPGRNKAFLKLSNGTVIDLDSIATGTIAEQGNTSVLKLFNGGIAYHSKGAEEAKTMINTMYTPRGGQYQLSLPDGTKVWLNAASSITYPTAFTGAARKVSITGEAYFEVAKDVSRSFHVSAGNMDVQVLGTHFNVNSYTNEQSTKATLLEGVVKICAVLHGTKSYESIVLKPGQQAALDTSTIVAQRIKVGETDTEKAIAWKNGAFNFKDATLNEVMRQLERWYNIDVIYAGKAPDRKFWGEMGRDLDLEDVLDFLHKSGIDFKLEGRKLIIYP